MAYVATMALVLVALYATWTKNRWQLPAFGAATLLGAFMLYSNMSHALPLSW